MSAAVKYGLVGGAVSLAILITQNYIVDDLSASSPIFTYLFQITFFVSIIAGIKVTKDKEITNGAIDLKSGLRAGIITVFIIVFSVGIFFFIFNKTISSEKLLFLVEKHYKESFERSPIKDTGEIKFNQRLKSADSAIESKDFVSARMFLEIANKIKGDDSTVVKKIKSLNQELTTQISSTSSILSQVFLTMTLQLFIGMVISFFATMVFRYKYQSDNS